MRNVVIQHFRHCGVLNHFDLPTIHCAKQSEAICETDIIRFE